MSTQCKECNESGVNASGAVICLMDWRIATFNPGYHNNELDQAQKAYEANWGNNCPSFTEKKHEDDLHHARNDIAVRSMEYNNG